MFVIKDNYELDWPVSILDTEITVRYTLLSKDEMTGAFEKNTRDLELLKQKIVSWQGVADEDGNEVPYSKDVLESLCKQHPFIERQLALGLLQASARGVVKNSNSGAAG